MLRVGNGVALQACSTSALDLVAGKLQRIRDSLGGSTRLNSRGRLGDWSSRGGNDFTAIDQVIAVVTNDGELLHRGLEHGGHFLLVSDERLPETGSAAVASKGEVGLETKFANHVSTGLRKWGRHLTSVVGRSWETGSLEESLEEELGVKLGWLR